MTSAAEGGGASDGAPGVSGGNVAPQTPVLTVQSCRMLRSPSHESVTTDLSLFSVSSIASDALARGMRLVSFKSVSAARARGPSPNTDDTTRSCSRPSDIPEILWFEEETDLIKNCAALSSALGLQKSFSTSDISQLPSPGGETGDDTPPVEPAPRSAVSELALNSLQRHGFILGPEHPRLEHASRSCSTWVAVGDVASTSQLPSPHGGQSTSTATSAQVGNSTEKTHTPPPQPVFTAADLIRSVNKKVRQNYIRRRLLTTYKALERLSQSEFNLDRLEASATTDSAAVINSSGNISSAADTTSTTNTLHLTVPTQTTSKQQNVLRVVKQRTNKNLPLTIRDVERERGKPLSKYERNMMIFNWLHTLDDSSFEGLQ